VKGSSQKLILIGSKEMHFGIYNSEQGASSKDSEQIYDFNSAWQNDVMKNSLHGIIKSEASA